jgi:hypothetical protein
LQEPFHAAPTANVADNADPGRLNSIKMRLADLFLQLQGVWECCLVTRSSVSERSLFAYTGSTGCEITMCTSHSQWGKTLLFIAPSAFLKICMQSAAMGFGGFE